MIDDLLRMIARMTQRERILLFLGIGLAAVALFYAGMVEPIMKRRSQSMAEIEESLALRSWIEGRVLEFQAVTSGGNNRGDWQRETIGISGVERSLSDASLRIYTTRLSDMPNGRIELSLGNVPFQDLLQWMEELQKTSGYLITRFSLTRQATAGMVDAELMLEPSS